MCGPGSDILYVLVVVSLTIDVVFSFKNKMFQVDQHQYDDDSDTHGILSRKSCICEQNQSRTQEYATRACKSKKTYSLYMVFHTMDALTCQNRENWLNRFSDNLLKPAERIG